RAATSCTSDSGCGDRQGRGSKSPRCLYRHRARSHVSRRYARPYPSALAMQFGFGSFAPSCATLDGATGPTRLDRLNLTNEDIENIPGCFLECLLVGLPGNGRDESVVEYSKTFVRARRPFVCELLADATLRARHQQFHAGYRKRAR